MKPIHNFSFTSYRDNQPVDKAGVSYQTVSNLKNSKVTEFFEYLYSYPPKFKIKWDSLDELTQDLFLENNYGVLEHSFPFIDFAEDIFFKGIYQESVPQEYSVKEFVNGYLDKICSSSFYSKKTTKIQEKLKKIGLCCMGFEWLKVEGGYQCAGGTHFCSDADVAGD